MSPRRRTEAHEPRHWRSLEQLADDPRARAFLEREFPRGAADPPEGVTRRTMLSLIGASLSMAGLTACRRPVEHIVPYVTAPEDSVPGIPRSYATTMPAGLSAYGLLVRSHEGRPTKIEGNPLHPSTAGSSNATIQASILDLYDPDRPRNPLQGAERKSWADFVTAWTALDEAHRADAGAGLAVLSESFCSPTLARLKRLFHERFPRARWATYEAVSDENVHGGIERATGSVRLPVQRLDRAEVILALDADLLLTDGEDVRHSRDFAAGRRVSEGREAMSRLYAVEGVHSLTGANADHRLRLQSTRIGALVALLAARLQASGLELGLPGGVAPEALAGVDPAWLDVLAADLLAHRGRSLIVAGRRQPPAVHAAVCAINTALGNVGATVDYREPRDAVLPRRGELAALARAMADGAVGTLIVLGGNPAYDAPADLGFAEALAGVPRLIRFGAALDETSRLAGWYVPLAHYLESWSDARAMGGVPSVVQPLIEPLFGARSAVELLGLLATGEDRPGYERVRETWQQLLGAADFESSWNRVLHDGLLDEAAEGAAAPPPDGRVWSELAAVLETSRAAAGNLEVVFQESPALHDGRFANNGWLQELPDPITKLTWDNAALLSPATAAEHALANEDLVRLSYRGRELELPVWIVPGQADGAVTLSLGYGRTAAGRVGDGVGVDVYALRTSDAPDVDRGLTLQKTGATYPLAQTQDHGSMEGRPLARQATLEHFRAHPEFAREMVEVPQAKPLWPEHAYTDGNQWGMTIDLNACTGCNACVIACQSENNIPVVGKDQVSRGREMHWLRIDRYFVGPESAPEIVFQAVPCMHCENAPCEQVCPVAATVHDEEGLNTMVYNRCIGTRYCSNNCPYKVRRFNFFNYTKDTPEILALVNNPDVTVRSRGVMEKCTYCTQRIQAAKIDAKLDGRELADGDVQTACQQACPASAIRFGNVLDDKSAVSRSKAEPRNYALLEELYTRPRTTYLAKLRNPHPGLGRPAANHAADETHGGHDG